MKPTPASPETPPAQENGQPAALPQPENEESHEAETPDVWPAPRQINTKPKGCGIAWRIDEASDD